MSDPAANKRLIASFWADLYRRDFDAVGAYFTDDGEYTDVPTPEDDVARGPREIAARLRLGLEPLEAILHHPKLMIAEDDVVITEHAEEWHWPSGEKVTIPFCSVHEIRNGKIVRWWDYPDLQKLLGAAPQWWIEHIMKGYK
jgi:ketosteroid isomerase-like protein